MTLQAARDRPTEQAHVPGLLARALTAKGQDELRCGRRRRTPGPLVLRLCFCLLLPRRTGHLVHHDLLLPKNVLSR
jgi:hypothetical protein